MFCSCQLELQTTAELLLSFYSAVVVTIGIYLGEPIRMPERCSTTQTEGVRRLAETMLAWNYNILHLNRVLRVLVFRVKLV